MITDHLIHHHMELNYFQNWPQVEIDVEDLYIVSCRASGGGTMLMSDQGHIYAAGVNR